MSAKAESKSVTKAADQKLGDAAQSSMSKREMEIMRKVMKVWRDFDLTPGLPTWKKKPAKLLETDPFGCTCGPCKRFWKQNFVNTSILKEPVLKRAQNTSTMFRPDQDDWRIKVGDRVIIDGKQTGVVRFVGLLDESIIAPPVYVGVKCDEHIGSTHNGIKDGKRYFFCSRGHGALVPYTDVRRLNPPETRPPLSGNYMFDSYEQVVKQRALRRQKMEAMAEETVRAKPPTRLRRTYTAFDENDIAYKDAQREGETQVYHYANSTVKVRTGGPPKPKSDPQARRFTRWKEEFGGGERGERLVQTLKKLHEALNKGKNLEDEPEPETPEEEEDDSQNEEGGTSKPTSKPPTRSGERPSPSNQSKSRPRTPANQ